MFVRALLWALSQTNEKSPSENECHALCQTKILKDILNKEKKTAVGDVLACTYFSSVSLLQTGSAGQTCAVLLVDKHVMAY